VPEEIAPKPWPGVQVTPDPNKRYLQPSELKNYWMTTQLGMKHFSAWCYAVAPDEISSQIDALHFRIQGQ
jgi:hypothetical protein